MTTRTAKSRKKGTEHIVVDTGKCEACWLCVDACKNDVLGKIDLWFHKHVKISNPENCTGCKRCIKTCPNGVFKSAPKVEAGQSMQ